MSEVVAQFDSLDAVFADGAMRLLRSDYAQASVALLRTLFGDGTSRMESEILYAQVDALLDELRQTDPVHFAEVDRRNPRRVIHAVEICRTAGRPYSDFRTRTVKVRPFRILKIGLVRPREELFRRIDARVDQMMADGLLREARALYPQRHLNALNTVGYKELFQHFDGQLSLDEAVARIKRNTRVYARKQQTWFRRDASITWFHPDDTAHILRFLTETL